MKAARNFAEDWIEKSQPWIEMVVRAGHRPLLSGAKTANLAGRVERLALVGGGKAPLWLKSCGIFRDHDKDVEENDYWRDLHNSSTAQTLGLFLSGLRPLLKSKSDLKKSARHPRRSSRLRRLVGNLEAKLVAFGVGRSLGEDRYLLGRVDDSWRR